MKNCEKAEKYLLDYVYNEIEDKELKKEIKRHLLECKSCMEKVEKYREIESTAKEMTVDFEDSVWSLHRAQIKDRLKKEKKGILENAISGFKHIFDIKNLGVALLIVFLAGAGTQYFKGMTDIKQQKEVIEKVDMFQNMEIIERLDFYTEISEKGNLL